MNQLSDQEEPELPLEYLVITISIGVIILVLMVWAGFSQQPFFATILIGGAAQTAHRVGKRFLRLSISEEDDDEEQDDERLTVSVLDNLVAIFLVMMVTTAFWYGIGAAAKWLIAQI